MMQMRNYIEELTGLIVTGKNADKPLAELQNAITISSLKALKANGYGTYVDENLERFSVYLGLRTALEDRLRANIEAIYINLDRA